MMRLPVLAIVAMASFAMLGSATLATAQVAKSKDSPESVKSLIGKITGPDRNASFQAVYELDERLREGGTAARDAAKTLLSRKAEFVAEPDVAKLLDELAVQDKPALAAELLLRIIISKRTVQNYKRGHVVVGRLVVEDGKQDPEMVMAQMPILKEGYFAGEVGDLARPIAFRSHGYQNLDVPLKGKTGDLVYLGDVTLKPLSESGGSSLRGKIVLDAPKDSESPSVSLSIMVGEPNTPHNGYSPRRGWPKPLELPVSKEGEFSATGLSPARYYLSISAKGHVDTSKMMSFESGKLLDAGTIHLRSTDLGLYVGKPAPRAKELAWEKDYPAALKRARDEKKPMLVMMTATWCGPCKLLEKETLSDPWVRHFLSGFVVVKAYEDKDVEEKYGLNGYPTLVFTDPVGKPAYKTVGYQPPIEFAGACAKAFDNLGRALPAELQKLVDEKVITLPK